MPQTTHQRKYQCIISTTIFTIFTINNATTIFTINTTTTIFTINNSIAISTAIAIFTIMI